MNLSKGVYYSTLLCVVATLLSSMLMLLNQNFKAVFLLLTIIFLYTSIILTGNALLLKYAHTTNYKIKKWIVYLGFVLIGFSVLVFFDVVSFLSEWNILIGITVLYLLMIQLNILGWSKKEHSFVLKIAFLIILICNLFLASVYFFKIDIYAIRPYILLTVCLSVLFLVVGIISTPKNKITSLKTPSIKND